MNMENYFREKQDKLKSVYQAFKSTPYGRELNLPEWNINSYEQFKNLPILNPKNVNFKDLFIPANNLWKFKTSGVSGNVKTVYRDIGTIVGHPKEMDEPLRNNETLFLHSKRREGESYYETLDYNHKRMYPNGIFGEFETREQLLDLVQKGNVLFIIEYPLMAEWICYQLEKAIKNKEVYLERLIKKKVYLELSGEPVTCEQVNDIAKRMENIFQCDVEYFVTYGSNEIGHIGTYIPNLHGSKIVYEVRPSLFIEEIDGELVITPFRTKGTILFRYMTGDKGELFFKNYKPFVKVYSKSKEEGIIYVAGAQISISELVSNIEKIVSDCPVGIEFIKKEDKLEGKSELNINVHVPQTLTDSIKNMITTRIKKFIIDSAILSLENHLGIIIVNVHYSQMPLKKRWFIVNNMVGGGKK